MKTVDLVRKINKFKRELWNLELNDGDLVYCKSDTRSDLWLIADSTLDKNGKSRILHSWQKVIAVAGLIETDSKHQQITLTGIKEDLLARISSAISCEIGIKAGVSSINGQNVLEFEL